MTNICGALRQYTLSPGNGDHEPVIVIVECHRLPMHYDNHYASFGEAIISWSGRSHCERA